MKKYLIIILVICSFSAYSQTYDTTLDWKGRFIIDTTYFLPRIAKMHFNAFGEFVLSNTDSVGVEGSTNKWYTAARSRADVSLVFTATGSSGPATGSYNNTTGVFAINVPEYAGGGGTYTGTANRITVTGTVIDIGTDVVTLTGTQTLTNKTLTQPVINSSSSTDTTTYKPFGVSSGGVTRVMDYWPGGGVGGSAAGSTNYIQYNVAGAFAADTTAKHSPTGFQLTAGPTKTYAATLFKGNISAVANNDTLVGLEINPKFTLGAFTNVKQIGLRVQGIEFGGGKNLRDGNIAIGVNGLQAISSGSSNIAIGTSVLEGTTSGSQNIGIGYRTLAGNTTGSDNVGVGFDAVRISSASQNTGVGTRALYNSSGGTNAAFGYYAMGTGINTGTYNSAFGMYALRSNTSGANNMAVGAEALTLNSTGSENVAVGTQSLSTNALGKSNTGVGHQTLLTTTGYSNTAIGMRALFLTTTGNNNIGIGDSAGYYNTTRSNQIYINSLRRLTDANDTTYSVFYAQQDFTLSSGELQRTKIGGGGTVGINGYGTSVLYVNGSFGTSYTATATSLTASISHSVIGVTATGQTITLPTAVGCSGRVYTIKLTVSGSATVATTSSETIDGSTTYTGLSAQYKYVTVQSTGSEWIIIGNN